VQLLWWALRPVSYLEACSRRYGETFTARWSSAPEPIVFVSHPSDVRRVFEHDREMHAGEARIILEPVLGSHSVLLLDDEDHASNRRLLMPPFHGRKVRLYGDVMRDVTDREIDRWPLGEPFSMRTAMQRVTLEVIMRTIFGVEDEGRLARLRERVQAMLERTNSRAYLGVKPLRRLDLPGSPLRRLTDAVSSVDDVLYDEIRRHRADPDLADRTDMLSLLIQARFEDDSAMSDRELRDHLVTFLIAGHETTATTLGWLFERVLRSPPVLARLRETLAAGDPNYLDVVIKETLRVRPVVPVVARKLVRPFELRGRELPAGTYVAPCIFLAGRVREFWPDPEHFRPERFEESRPEAFTWIPFGGGIRSCLGGAFALFEMKTVVSRVFERTRLRAPSQEDEPFRRRAVTLVPGRGAEVICGERRAAPPAAEGGRATPTQATA
jgi:cytochrome P450 family 135